MGPKTCPESGRCFGPAYKKIRKNVAKKWPHFCVRDLDPFQAEAVWRWFRFLESRVPAEKRPLILNLDETSVRFYYTPQKGVLVPEKSTTEGPKAAPMSGRNTSRGQMRKALSHVAIITSDFAVQKSLPQILMVARRVCNKKDMAAACAAVDAPVELWPRTSGWVNQKEFAVLLTRVAAALEAFPDRQPILLLDAHRVHCSEETVKHAASVGIWICVIPASCTHVLQPLDTDVFARYKMLLRAKLLERSASGPNADLPFPVIAEAVSKTIHETFFTKSLASVFGRNGFGQTPYARASLMRMLPETVHPGASCEMPEFTHLSKCFPTNATIPVDPLLLPPIEQSPRRRRIPFVEKLKTSVKRKAAVFSPLEPWSRARLRPRTTEDVVQRLGSKLESSIAEIPRASTAASSWETMPRSSPVPRRLLVLTPEARFPPRRRSQDRL